MIKINSKISFSYNKPPLIIAEISGNHNQSKKFLKLIDLAFKNGADLVKIQTYEPKDITLNLKNKNFLIKKGLWKKNTFGIYIKKLTHHLNGIKMLLKLQKIIRAYFLVAHSVLELLIYWRV